MVYHQQKSQSFLLKYGLQSYQDALYSQCRERSHILILNELFEMLGPCKYLNPEILQPRPDFLNKVVFREPCKYMIATFVFVTMPILNGSNLILELLILRRTSDTFVPMDS